MMVGTYAAMMAVLSRRNEELPQNLPGDRSKGPIRLTISGNTLTLWYDDGYFWRFDMTPEEALLFTPPPVDTDEGRGVPSKG